VALLRDAYAAGSGGVPSTLLSSVSWAIGAKRNARGWGTGVRSEIRNCRELDIPFGIPTSRAEADARICSFVYERGIVDWLTPKTVASYVGNVLMFWRTARPSVVPALKEKGLHSLALAKMGETNRTLPQRFQAVSLELAEAVMELPHLQPVERAGIAGAWNYFPRPNEYTHAGGTDWDRNVVRFGDVKLTDGATSLTFGTRKNNTAQMGQKQTQSRNRTDGTLCFHRRMREWLRMGASTERLSAYGLRVGPVTHLKRAGVEEVALMLAGGWATVSGMRGYCQDDPADSSWLSDTLAVPVPAAVAGGKRARMAGPPDGPAGPAARDARPRHG